MHVLLSNSHVSLSQASVPSNSGGPEGLFIEVCFPPCKQEKLLKIWFRKTLNGFYLLLKINFLVRSAKLPILWAHFSPALSHSTFPLFYNFFLCCILLSLSGLQWADSFLPQGLCRWCFSLPATFSSHSWFPPLPPSPATYLLLGSCLCIQIWAQILLLSWPTASPCIRFPCFSLS